uniref:LIM domain only protein 7 isoform X11 n=1 Tax=Solea senegalensis TaxID=28829 RepID=UPI001CD82DE2|nr:LIM domain only protein 7 isoform X11 [Solea senegalensis]
MEWREQSNISCDEAFVEAQRWIEGVTKKKFGSNNFRSALENGVLLCELINKIRPGIIKRINRLPTPIAGLDNLNVFLRACGKLGLKEAQLFHPGDLQDLSTRVTVKHQETDRRLKNVLISIYWLGRKAQCDNSYDGPYLNFKAFEGLLGTALYKALQESSTQKGSNVRDSGFGDSWYSEREELYQLRGGGGGGHRSDDSLDSLDSLGSRPHSISSDTTLKGSSEGCCSDTEADSIYSMAGNKDTLSYRRSVVITPKTAAQFNQFLPTKDKSTAYVPAPLRKKRAERNDDNRRSWANPIYTEDDGRLTSQASQSTLPTAHEQWAYEYESGSESDIDRPDPDLVLDDLASRRFHSPSPALPTNFAVPFSHLAGGGAAQGARAPWPKVTVGPSVATQQNVTCLSSSNISTGETLPPQHGSVKMDQRGAVCTDSLFKEIYDDSDDDDDEVGYADPVQDDLYSRKMGVKPEPAANISYDKFLPKFWTPEEDDHIQKIKMGSQRRPWYKKMQGLSHKKTSSSSDDSDCDVSPRPSSAPSSCGPSPSHSHTHKASTHTTLVVGKSPHNLPHTPQQLPEIQPPLLPPPPLVFAPVDPTSGPKLVKGEKWHLLGRNDPREPPDPFNYESIPPDLENDDMFARRTLAFQSNTDLAMTKTQLSKKRHRYSSEPQLNIITQQHSRGNTEENEFPDIEQDDVVYRKEKTEQAQRQRPLSGAPDNYAPMPIPEPWALPPDLKARLLCLPCPLTQREPTNKDNQVENETHPKTDDMLVRKLGAFSDHSSSANQAPSVPSSCSEGDLQRWQDIRKASQLRYKKKLMVERLSEKNCSDQEKSKSTSDIQTDTAILRQARYEELQKFREQIKESDDKWQDDLSKWKTRRKSVNSDIVKKKEEREKIEQITVSGNRRSKTFKEMQEERENKSRNSIGSRLGSLSYPDNDDVFDGPVIAPRTRTLPPRSYTIDTPYYSSEPSQPSLKEEEPFAAVPAPGRAAFPPTKQEINILDSPAGSDTTTAITPSLISYSRSSQRAADVPLEKSPVSEYSRTTKTEETTTIVSSSSSLQKVPEPRGPLLSSQTKVEAPSSGFLYKQQPQLSSMEPKPPGVSRVSASLPRSYQRLDSARLTSVVAPRPFGTSRISSLSRSSTTDDSHKRVNGDASVSKKSSVPSRYQQFMTSEDEAQSSSAHSSEDEEEEAAETQSLSPVPPPVKSDAPVSPARAKDNSQENYCEMRINLNQKPNSSRDFGFQAAWDSTGAHVTSIQSGSPAEMCRLQVGDEVLTVNRHKVAEMSYTDWKAYMEEAIQEGSLVMDIRRHGQNNWDRNQLSLPFKSHKTINLTSTDHPILLGSPDTNIINPSLDFTSRISTGTLQSKEGPANPVLIVSDLESPRLTQDLASNRVNGSFHEKSVTMRNKESEPISLKNLKRRSEFFETGGSEAVLPEIPVPPITPSSSSRWSWDPEEERRRQEKWQKEQERQLQEKYKRDQEKLQEEWQKAQEEIAKNKDQQELTKLGRLEGNSRSISPFSSLPQVNQATTTLWEEEERKRKEEHERQRQAEERERQRQAEERERQRQAEEQERQRQAEERRKREEEEAQELQRLQEERERKEKERKERQEEERKERQEEERKRREEELRWQRRREEEREEERRRQEAVEQQRRERERAFQQQQQKQQWAANVQPPLSYTDRIKSKSSPQLDEEERPQRRGVYVQPRGIAHWLLEEQLRIACDRHAQSQQAASQLEMERRNILSAMRYREPERVTGSGLDERKGQQALSQSELERQQILNEMKKKTSLLTDSSWIRQQSSGFASNKESDVPPMRRGESLDNLDASYNSWRSSWTPRSNSYAPNYTRPHSALSGSTSFYSSGSATQRPSSTLPSSYSMGSLQSGAGTSSSLRSWRTPSPSFSSSTTSPEPTSEAGVPQQRSRSVSGKKVCTFCDTPLGKGAAMIIESLGLCYHLGCFKCIECKSNLGGSEAGAEVRIRNKQLYCNTCYMRFKSGQPTSM